MIIILSIILYLNEQMKLKKKKEKLYLYGTLIHLFQIEIFIYISSSFLEDYRAKGKKIRVLSTKFRMNNLLISK